MVWLHGFDGLIDSVPVKGQTARPESGQWRLSSMLRWSYAAPVDKKSGSADADDHGQDNISDAFSY
jgi:hypothetical protein